jgi:hypothetical protein
MMKKVIIAIAVVIVFFHIASGQIKTGSATLKMNCEISFRSGAMHEIGFKNDIPYPASYPCSTSVDTFDFFFISRDCGTCTYYCPCELVGSARPFYISKKSINQIGKENRLDITDTSVVNKVFSMKNCFIASDSSVCVLPSISTGNINRYCQSYDWSHPLIALTKQNKYVLMTLTPLYQQSCDMTIPTYPDCRSYVGSIAISWFLQQDGTTNFNGVFTSIIPNAGKLSGQSAAVYTQPQLSRFNNAGIFDILGRRLPPKVANTMRLHETFNSKIFISEKSSHVVLLFPMR